MRRASIATFQCRPKYWLLADNSTAPVFVRFWGVKRTSQLNSAMSAFDPKRTSITPFHYAKLSLVLSFGGQR
jgi:hypothetical protein